MYYLFLLSIPFLVSGLIVLNCANRNKKRFNECGEVVHAKILKINKVMKQNKSKTFRPIVSYSYNDVPYETTLKFYSSSMRVGDYIGILIDKNNPDKVITNSSLLYIISYSLLSASLLVCIIVGLIILFLGG